MGIVFYNFPVLTIAQLVERETVVVITACHNSAHSSKSYLLVTGSIPVCQIMSFLYPIISFPEKS